MKTIWGVAVAGSLALTALALAQGPGGGGGPQRGPAATVESMTKRLMAYDKNNDGKLSSDELTDERLSSLFERADADQNKVIDKAELTAYFTKELESLPSGPPGNGPGGPGPGGGPGGGGPGDAGGPGRGGPPQPGQVLSPGMQQELRLTEAQRKQIADLQKDVDARLSKILTADQQRQLRELRDRGPRGGGPGGGGPGNGPPPRRPGQ